MSRDYLARARNTKRCEADCGERVHVRGPDEEAHYIVEYRTETEKGLGDKLYYHGDCAPFGATSIPDKVE